MREASEGAVIVVEGFFDALKVHQAGFPAVAALMGSSMSQEQEDLLTDHFDRVILMLDGDEPGRLAAEEISGRLTRKVFVKVVDVPESEQPVSCPAGSSRGYLEAEVLRRGFPRPFCLGKPRSLALVEQVVEGFSEQLLDSSVLLEGELAELLGDSRVEMAGDGLLAGATRRNR